MRKIITIGRKYGSGGRYIAKKVAEKLGVKCYDNELLLKIAKDNGLSEAVVKEYDEKGALLSNLYCSFVNDNSLQGKLIEAQFSTILSLADKEDCVIVGRCADYILRNVHSVLSVFITSDMESRVKRGIEFYNLEPDKAEDIIKKNDKRRASYYNFYTDKKWGRADSYHLCVDSAIGIDETADIIIKYSEDFFNKKSLKK